MNRKAGAALVWLPVLGLVALLFAIPGGSSGAAIASLTVCGGSAFLVPGSGRGRMGP